MTAIISMTVTDDGDWTSVNAVSTGESVNEARSAVQSIFDWMGKGRKRLVRCKPTAKSQHNFERDIPEIRGSVRFSFSNRIEGTDEYPEPQAEVVYMGGKP